MFGNRFMLPSAQSRNRSLLATLSVLAVGLSLIGASAAQAEAWRMTVTRSCDRWNWDREYRCLLQNEAATQAFTVTNKVSYQVSFFYDEWHSACGWGGVKVHREYVTLQPYETRKISLLSPGNGITCREVFLNGCSNGSCVSSLNATISAYVGNLQ